MNPGKELSPIDEMLGIMLEKWRKLYSFELDRVSRKIEFTRGEIRISAQEIDGGLIRVSIIENGNLFTRDGNPADSAKAVEAVILTEKENQNVPEKPVIAKPWWKFWR